jgi:predicted ester cyclase
MPDNEAIVRRFIEEYQNTGDERVADEILAHDFVDHCPFGPFAPDREGVKQLFRMLRSAFPDLRAEVKDQFSAGDKVVTRKIFHGTNDGEFMGMPPTSKKVSFDVIDILRLRDGQFTDHWNVVDAMGLTQQLGAVPAPA